ncbi:putative histone deacetylase [Neospora caninum Liverpool]|uniref:histone deacetylase n=1 Tax=Neospora caninum (strain Liverpool) TaxID=572307 RepID=F0VR05_NEOCL|nr:putative histone deacetylase [Neospora caninum Liverpool]CBZ56152.1 putative histone deacetylase [Neospora caninum Liverpool]CEL70908.1 TPA: histone deacetylase, putative [Neospora caninum Liverpool]|eukprot:XP_003886178.1 putative histone deacetylase [Neospora caninum Liverpool]
MGRRKSVLYFYDDNIGNFHYGPSHPMKPHRVRMTHDLIQCYGLLGRMDMAKPLRPAVEELTRFHANDYVDFLRSSAQSRLEASLSPRPFLFFSPSPAATRSTLRASPPPRSETAPASRASSSAGAPSSVSVADAQSSSGPRSRLSLPHQLTRSATRPVPSDAAAPRETATGALGSTARGRASPASALGAPAGVPTNRPIDLGAGGWSREGGEKQAVKAAGEGAAGAARGPVGLQGLGAGEEADGTGRQSPAWGPGGSGAWPPPRKGEDTNGLLTSAAFDEVEAPPMPVSSSYADQMARFNVGEDCPVFDGLWEYCQTYSGGSIEGARRVVNGEYDWAINWAGGLHHGKKHEASGFCYINDCVLAALEFLRFKHRVLYVDVDIHHGDGVEEAFYTSPRVMCCSFHKYGDYFPGTGALDDVGIDEGLGYSVNVPLSDGIDDAMYTRLFRQVMDMVIDTYRPEAVVLQCGADSLSGDRLGCFNLSIEGHSEAVRYFRSKNIPAVFLGGGGYTLRNVPRCWATETGHVLGVSLNPNIPEESEYVGYYGPDSTLHVRTSNMENRNEEGYIQHVVQKISQTLKDHVRPVGAQISANFSLDESVMDKGERIRALLADKEEEKAMDSSGDGEEADGVGLFEDVSNRNRG